MSASQYSFVVANCLSMTRIKMISFTESVDGGLIDDDSKHISGAKLGAEYIINFSIFHLFLNLALSLLSLVLLFILIVI